MASAFIKFTVPEDSLKTIAAGKSRIRERSLLIERLLSDEWRLARHDKNLPRKPKGQNSTRTTSWLMSTPGTEGEGSNFLVTLGKEKKCKYYSIFLTKFRFFIPNL